MKNFTKKTASMLLTMLFAGTLLASCGGGNDTSAGNDTAQTSDATAAETTVSDEPVFPDVNLDGEAIHFLSVLNSGLMQYSSFEIFSEGMDGSLINDTVYQRNLVIEEKFNVEITEHKAEKTHTVASETILAGDDEYDVVAPYLNNSITNALEGLYYDLNSVEYLELENEWWDQPANESLSIGGKTYFSTGDISILDNECTMVLFFNKQMIKEYSLDNPYDLVRNGTWTMDKMFEMGAAVAGDANGDGQLVNTDDRFGFNCAWNSPLSLYYASGERIVSNNADGKLELVMNSERVVNVMDSIMQYCYGDSVMRNATGVEAVGDSLMNGRLLITGWALTDINFIRDSEQDFGVLPYPKYTADQENYYSLISTSLVPGYSIPVTNAKPENAGLILEALAYYSVDTLTVAYYDTALNDRYIRDTESGEMLDIIFASRVYDFGYINNIGGLGELITNVYKSQSNTFASQYASLEAKALAAIDELNGSFE